MGFLLPFTAGLIITGTGYHLLQTRIETDHANISKAFKNMSRLLELNTSIQPSTNVIFNTWI